MPRRARIAVAGIPWHIIQRGNNRSPCFYAEDDYRYYLEALKDQANKFECAIHAYCLMTNHVHLLLTPESADGPSLLMKHLGQRYVQYINKTYDRSGTLWDGRFKSCLAQESHYTLTCYRYIELNPVRANMVPCPDDYPWSSYRSNGCMAKNSIITPHADYLRLGNSDEERSCAYRALFRVHLDNQSVNKIRNATNGNFVLGNDRFEIEIAEMLGRRVVSGSAGRPRNRGQTTCFR